MTATTTTCARFIGCDVGKTSIEIFDSRGGARKTIPNLREALADFAESLDADCLVVCEATGGYEALLLDALTFAGVPVHRADARKVKAFIRSFGVLGKTDAIDARALARYGQERGAELPRWRAPDAARRDLQSLVLLRRDLVAQRVACANRLQAPGGAVAKPYLRPVADALEAQIRALDAAIAGLIRESAALAKAEAVLRGIAGVGKTTAAALLAMLPELGTCDRKKIAALAGLAPHPRQSGASDGYRRVTGGRPEIKRVVFMAALSAARHNPTLRDAYARLLANAKKPSSLSRRSCENSSSSPTPN